MSEERYFYRINFEFDELSMLFKFVGREIGIWGMVQYMYNLNNLIMLWFCLVIDFVILCVCVFQKFVGSYKYLGN